MNILLHLFTEDITSVLRQMNFSLIITNGIKMLVRHSESLEILKSTIQFFFLLQTLIFAPVNNCFGNQHMSSLFQTIKK